MSKYKSLMEQLTQNLSSSKQRKGRFYLTGNTLHYKVKTIQVNIKTLDLNVMVKVSSVSSFVVITHRVCYYTRK